MVEPQSSLPLEPARPRRKNPLWISVLVGCLFAALIYLGVLDARGSRGIPKGQPAPAFSFQRHQGGVAKLTDYQGKLVMLDFWATWCPPCVEEMPTLVRLAKEYEPRGLVFVAANRDEPSEAKAAVGVFVATRVPGLGPYVAFADDRSTASYLVRTLPTLYLIDRRGKVVDSHVGLASESALRGWIEEALEASP